MSHHRIVDPREQIVRAGMEAEGFVTQRQLGQRDEELARLAEVPGSAMRVVVQETQAWFRADIGSAGLSTSYFMRPLFLSSDTAVAVSSQALVVPGQCRLLFGRLTANADATAGTAQLEIRVVEDGVTTDYALEEVELSTSAPRTKAAIFPWQSAIQISRLATVQARVKVDGSWAPTTADMQATIVLGYEYWVSA